MNGALAVTLGLAGTAALLRAAWRVGAVVDGAAEAIGARRLAVGVTALAVVAGAAGAVLWLVAALAAEWRGAAFLAAEVAATVTGEAAAVGVLAGGVWTRRLAWGRAPGWAYAVAAGAVPAFLGVSWLYEAAITRLVAVAPQGAVQTLLALPPGARGVAAFAIVAVAPLAEELLFRGAWFGRLQPLVGPRVTVVVTGLAFGLAHAGSPWTVPLLAAMGLGLGALRAASGSIWPGVVVHAANNGFAVAVVLAGESLSRYL